MTYRITIILMKKWLSKVDTNLFEETVKIGFKLQFFIRSLASILEEVDYYNSTRPFSAVLIINFNWMW